MRDNLVKRILVVPLLSILTIFILPLILYWSPRCRAFWFYSQVTSLEEANAVLIVGREKNFDICDFRDET